MTFVFLELRPLAPEQLPSQLAAVAFCALLLVVALIIHALAGGGPGPASEALPRPV